MHNHTDFPELLYSTEELDEVMTRPHPAVCASIEKLEGDLMLLGAAGKMGVSLAVLAKRAVDEIGTNKRVVCISRFSDSHARQTLDAAGIETIAGDLLDDTVLQNLPDIDNIIYMAGMKFGTTGNAAATWAINSFLPGLVARRFRHSRIVLFSTGNVYPLVRTDSGGCTEAEPPAPIGEYAQSAFGRERIFEYFSRKNDTPSVIFRLNYAVDLRYGVLLDIAQKVYSGQPVNVQTGFVNLIWQGDANAIALRCLQQAQSPPFVLNVTGQQTHSVRELAHRFGEIFDKKPRFEGKEADTAFLSNASLCHRLYGEPAVSIAQMIRWVAHWVEIGGPVLGKPTHFEVRSGDF